MKIDSIYFFFVHLKNKNNIDFFFLIKMKSVKEWFGKK